MDTDYETYSIVYSCENWFGGLASFDYMWILSRTPGMEEALVSSLVAQIEEKVANYEFYEDARFARVGDSC